jgi:serine/threonine protein phosphatase PrpC
VVGRDDVTFIGVFDGTVGDNASDFAHHYLADNICLGKVSERRQ